MNPAWRVALIAFVAALGADAVAAPPPTLSAFADGPVRPEDFAWARGAFEDANPTDRAAWAALRSQSETGVQVRREAVRQGLRAQGIEAPDLPQQCFGEELCQLISSITNRGPALRRWADFEAAFGEGRAPFMAYRAALKAVDTRLSALMPETAYLADRLKSWTVLDQAWRTLTPETFGNLSPAAVELVQLLGDLQGCAVDQANLSRLKAVVDEDGWPTIGKVGAEASGSAWLLAQHADEDPVFQLRTLKLMEPLVGPGEVSARNHAYLHDRVMLKLVGKQRYGTQMWCVNGKFAPRPLEHPDRLEDLRRGAGLGPMQDYLNRFPPSC
jgi:hypothetical protein